MTNTFRTCYLLLLITFLTTCFDFTNNYASCPSQIDTDQAHLSAEQLTQNNLSTFILDCLNQQQPIDEIIIGAQKLGYTEEQIAITLPEILQQETPTKTSNLKTYLIAGVCIVALIPAVIGCIKLYYHWQNEALYQHDETQPLNIRMTLTERAIDFAGQHQLPGEDQRRLRRQIEAQAAGEIERGIAQNRPPLDIINDIRNANHNYEFYIETSGRGSLIGTQLQGRGPQRRIYPGERFVFASAAEAGNYDSIKHTGWL